MRNSALDDRELLRRIEFFGHGEELGDAVPVTAGEGSFQRAVERRPRQLRASHAVGEIHVELAAAEMQFFRFDLHGANFCERFFVRIACKKADEQFAWFDVAALGERISRDDVAKFGGGAVNDAGAKSEFAFKAFSMRAGRAARSRSLVQNTTLPLLM